MNTQKKQLEALLEDAEQRDMKYRIAEIRNLMAIVWSWESIPAETMSERIIKYRDRVDIIIRIAGLEQDKDSCGKHDKFKL